jgi:O-antigen ligase
MACFILWLFRRYTKLVAPLSWGSWVAFVWLAIIASRPVGYWFANGTTASTADPLGGSFIDRNTYLFLIILGIIALARRRVNWPWLLAPGRVLWLFYAYLLISVVWSDHPFVAFKRWFKDFGNVVMILVLLTEEDPVEAVRGIFVRCAYLLVPVSVLFIKWFPDLGRYLHPWTWTTLYCGVTTNKNSLGDVAMVSGLVLLWSLVDFQGYPGKGRTWKEVWPDLFVLGMCFWLLHMAQSATSLSCFVVGAVILFASRLDWVKNNVGKLGWCSVGLILFFIAFATLPGFRGAIAGVLGRDVTLTGRTDIWEAALKLPVNPALGSGFGSAWLTPEGMALAEEMHIPHAHNGYLETYLHSGLIGVVLLLAALHAAGRTASRNLLAGTICGNFFMAFFVGGVVYNLTEVAFNDGNIIEFGMWLMAALGGALLAKNGADEEDFHTSLAAGPTPDSDEVTAKSGS